MRGIRSGLASVTVLALATLAHAQSSLPSVPLRVASGRPLDFVLDKRLVIKHVGQSITATVVQPVYAYDRVVIPAGTRVTGVVAKLEKPSKVTRIRAMLSGDLSPARVVVLQFDTLILDSGEAVPFQSEVTEEIPHARRTSAPPAEDPPEDSSHVGRAEHEVKDRARAAIADARQQGRDILAEIRHPGRMTRFKDELVQRLPYHPQVIAEGTGYHAELLAPLDFGVAAPSDAAPSGARPAPATVLSARLLTTLDSATSQRGMPVQAAVTEPVFSIDHQLIVPEGTLIEGTVTLARPARRLHRNGQLRFLVETIHREPTESAASAPLLASLRSVEASADDHVTIDEEGGTTLKNPRTRFIAPALAVLALRANLDQHEHLDPDGDGHLIREGAPGARTTGGFFGLGVLGIGLGQLSRPLGVSLSVAGAARTTYRNLLGRGREVKFPAGTMMQLQLAPGPPSAQ